MDSVTKWRAAQDAAGAEMILFRQRKPEDVEHVRSVLGPIFEADGDVKHALLHKGVLHLGAVEWVLFTVKAHLGYDLGKAATIDHYQVDGRFRYSIHPPHKETLDDGREREYDTLFGLWDTASGEWLPG
jgi:hypothetical protein